MAEATSPHLRARHDAGRPPVLLRRLVVLVGSLGVTTGLTVAGVGMFRQGPLAWLGWSEQVLSPEQVLATGPPSAAVDLKVAVRWDRDAFCPKELRVDADQSAPARVVIREVTSRVPRFAMLGPHCAEQRASQGRAYASLRLDRPLQGRLVVDGAGHRLDIRNG
jgi:hypothetical protein